MKKFKVIMILMMMGSLLVGCDLMPRTANESVSSGKFVEGERIDAEVVIAEDANFSTMDAKEKGKIYAELDKIETDEKGTKSPISYANIVELKSDEEYTHFILDSQKEAKIIYLGFDECPFCKAFSPKISQFAKEKGVTVYYYNTRKRVDDANFQTAMSTYNVETVPHAFIVKDGKVIDKINHKNSMASIEAFVNKVVEMNQ